MSARPEPELRRAVRTVLSIHRQREAELRRALESGDPEEVVRCLRRQRGVQDEKEGDRAPQSE
jgi:hypothetical protein